MRLATGDERKYGSIDDMIWDVETGVITPDALLFHAASGSWVAVTRNPRLAARLKTAPRPGEVPLEFDPLPADDGLIRADSLLETDERRNLDAQAAILDDLHGGPSLGLTSNAEFFAAVQGTAPPTPPQPPQPPAPPAAPPSEPPTPIIVPGSPPPPAPAPAPPPPAAALPEPPLDGDLAPLPGEELDEAPIEYKPVDWKPDRDYRHLIRLAVRTVVVVAVIAGGAFGFQAWQEHRRAALAAAADSLLPPQAVDTIPDSVLAAAVAMMEEAETTDAEVLLRRRRAELAGRGGGTAAAARPIAGLRAMTAAELRRSYTVSYAYARSAMDSTLAAAGVVALFAPERLGTLDSLRAGRRIVVAARNVLRAYNRTEVQIERAFRDTVQYQVRRMGWDATQQAEWKARAALKESYEGSQLADSLLKAVDGIYATLIAQRGRYDMGPEGILFSDPRAANEYARHANWLAARMDRFSQLQDQASWPTARRLVAAMQGTRPPALLQGGLGS